MTTSLPAIAASSTASSAVRSTRIGTIWPTLPVGLRKAARDRVADRDADHEPFGGQPPHHIAPDEAGARRKP